MLHALTVPVAALVTLSLWPSPASARFDRLPSHNMARRDPHSSPNHHRMAGHLLHKRDALDDAVAAISSALESPTVDGGEFEVGTVLAGSAQKVAPHEADLGSAYLLVSKASATSEAAAQKEGEEEKALKSQAVAAKSAKAKVARLAQSSSAASLKSASSIRRSKSIKAASKLKSARKAASSKSKSASLSASRSRHSSAAAANASQATSSKKHASAVKLLSLSAFKAKASALKSKSQASASKSKAEAKQASAKSSSTPKTSAVAKAKVANTSKAGTILAGVFNNKGLKGFVATNACGASEADNEYPNGAEAWLNCGISTKDKTSGWTPPGGVTIDRLAYVSLETAMAENSVWTPCEPYIPLFEKWGAATGLPPILLASLAMQESTCNEDESGDSGGAFGLMQITKDKCDGRDTAGCNDPDFNIMTGAQYFASQLSAFDGNVLLALGQYNGWYQGLSYTGATAAAYTGCCECQNNLDDIHQMLNGWLQGKTGYELGSIGNLDVCGL